MEQAIDGKLQAMDMRQLRAFLAVYEEGSFSRAAERINATQPGLSVRISGLEADLRVQLFERRARGVVPTVAGQRLYRRGIQILHDINAAVGEMHALSGTISGSLAVGIPPTLSRAVLASVLSEFVKQAPNVDVRIVEAYSTTLVPLLESRELDIAFVTHVPDHPGIAYDPIYADRFVLVSGPTLDLPAGEFISLDSEPTLKLVIPSPRHGLHKLIGEPFETGRINAARTMEIDGLSGTLEFIADSDWAALLPFAAVHNAAGDGLLRVNPIAGEDIVIRYFAARVASEPLEAAAVRFVSLASAAFDHVARKWIDGEAARRA